MSIKGVCFDLDGTLLDTLADLADSMNRTLERHGLPTHPVEAYKTFVGNGLTVLVRRAAPAAEGDDDLARTDGGGRLLHVLQCIAHAATAAAQRGCPTEATGPTC